MIIYLPPSEATNSYLLFEWICFKEPLVLCLLNILWRLWIIPIYGPNFFLEFLSKYVSYQPFLSTKKLKYKRRRRRKLNSEVLNNPKCPLVEVIIIVSIISIAFYHYPSLPIPFYPIISGLLLLFFFYISHTLTQLHVLPCGWFTG